MPDIVAETERLILRTVGEGDEAEHARVLNSATIMRHIGGPMEPTDIEQRHAKQMASQAAHGFSFVFAIEKATGEMVGYLGIKRVENPRAPNVGDHEIGWKVREDRWRRGYAEEAMRAVLEWAFDRLDLPYVVALTSAANEGSWRLMEKLGMERRPELDFDDPDYPPEDRRTIQYSLTAQDWRASR